MYNKMCSQLQVVVLALSVLVLASWVRAAPRADVLAHLLQNEADGNEDLAHILLLKLLSEVEIPDENDMLSVRDGEEARDRTVRQLPLSQRERKAGCRNFFWKTFTSC